MRGQWIGSYTGTSSGSIVVNIDELTDRYQGWAYLNENNQKFPSTAVFFKTESKKAAFQLRTPTILPIDPRSGTVAPWENVKQRYPEAVNFSKYADVTGSWTQESLELSWTTDIGVTGTCVLPRSRADKPSELEALEKGWGTFKEYVASLGAKRYLFRGQNHPWRLRTSFHRAGRTDLTRFLNEDIQVLHKHLSASPRSTVVGKGEAQRYCCE